jgi:hypothetical protein
MRSPYLTIFAVVLMCGSPALATELPAVAGVSGLRGSVEAAWLAVRISVPENSALAGFLWYNNDGQVTYPALLVGTGCARGPGALDQMTNLAGPLGGGSDAWSELELEQPVVASEGTVYVVFEFPAETEFTGRGTGGGPALGYIDDATGTPGWISGDGETWLQLAGGHSFAVLPQFVPIEPGMLVKSMGGEAAVPDLLPSAPYLVAGPNPFNPRTDLRFGLSQAGHTRVAVFDVRGRRVAQLVSEPLAAGHHTVAWLGRDDQGRSVASGVYIVHLSSGKVQLTQRLLLVR